MPAASRHLQPDVARAHGAAPAFAGLLARHGDEAEIPDRRAIGMSVAVNDDHALAETRGGECMRQSANASADHGNIEWTWQMTVGHVRSLLTILLVPVFYGRSMKSAWTTIARRRAMTTSDRPAFRRGTNRPAP